jgi:hypothetical protein
MTFEISGGAPDIPPGTYKAQLEKTTVKTEGRFGDFRLWDWLVEVEGELVPLSVSTSLNTGPRTNTFAWLTALLGRAPSTGEKLDDPTGKTVLLQISHKENGWPKIDAVLPYAEPQQTAGIPR